MSEQKAATPEPEVPTTAHASSQIMVSLQAGRADVFAVVPHYRARVQFTGRGSEYFRIWIVHLLLMLLTLGLYSPWAKVRKMRWFAQNTRLLGDRFDFHAEPRRILIGRLLAFGLLLMWWLGFSWSPALGWLTVSLILLAGPALFASAQRFRLANLSWRGLRFGFDPPMATVYAAGVPALGLWMLGTVLTQLEVADGWVVAGGVAFVLAMPVLHARLKVLQHNHARYGNRQFSMESGLAGRLAAIYAATFGLVLATIFAGLIVGALGAGIGSMLGLSKMMMTWMPWLVAGLFGLCMVAVGYPFSASRVQEAVWGRTRWGLVRFEGRMQARALTWICLKQGVLVLCTAGLYWPWASVALARYRLQSLVVVSDEPLNQWVVQRMGPAGDARSAGDAAADLFGLDVGW